jgi:hypothetical protein
MINQIAAALKMEPTKLAIRTDPPDANVIEISLQFQPCCTDAPPPKTESQWISFDSLASAPIAQLFRPRYFDQHYDPRDGLSRFGTLSDFALFWNSWNQEQEGQIPRETSGIIYLRLSAMDKNLTRHAEVFPAALNSYQPLTFEYKRSDPSTLSYPKTGF